LLAIIAKLVAIGGRAAIPEIFIKCCGQLLLACNEIRLFQQIASMQPMQGDTMIGEQSR
jgi:hypothetical protein